MVLTWHVDDWDRLGCQDPFASADYTARQTRYQKARKLANKWTPQFVVDNEVVINRQARAIPETMKQAHAHAHEPAVGLETVARVQDGKVHVRTILRVSGETALPRGTTLLPFLYRKRVETTVPREENEGCTLTEHHVVIATGRNRVAADARGQDGLSLECDLSKGSSVADLGIAILVEDVAAMRTLQCGSVDVSAPVAKPPPEAD